MGLFAAPGGLPHDPYFAAIAEEGLQLAYELDLAGDAKGSALVREGVALAYEGGAIARALDAAIARDECPRGRPIPGGGRDGFG